MDRYLATDQAAPVMRHRLGDIRLTPPYGDARSAARGWHPAGMCRLGGDPGGGRTEVWVVSPTKTAPDRLSRPFEPCAGRLRHECTFGLPVFKWSAEAHGRRDQRGGPPTPPRAEPAGAYALGKAQRVLECWIRRDPDPRSPTPAGRRGMSCRAGPARRSPADTTAGARPRQVAVGATVPARERSPAAGRLRGVRRRRAGPRLRQSRTMPTGTGWTTIRAGAETSMPQATPTFARG